MSLIGIPSPSFPRLHHQRRLQSQYHWPLDLYGAIHLLPPGVLTPTIAACALVRGRLDRHSVRSPLCFHPGQRPTKPRCRGIASIGVGFWKQSPNYRPFSPVNPELSYPHIEHEKVTTPVLGIVSLLVPAIITFLVAVILTPGCTVAKDTPRDQIWRRKAWEWNTAWMGLGLCLATTFFFTESMKNFFGKPRPDLLSRCNLDPEMVHQYAIGGYGTQMLEWNLLVSRTACRQTDSSILKSGFKSFPSGHSSCEYFSANE